MRLKLKILAPILNNTHKVWLNCLDLEYISDLIYYISDTFNLSPQFDLFLDDFYLHPDLVFFEALKDSDLVTVVAIDEAEKLINVTKKFQKQNKNFKRQMKRSPKLLKFTGKRVKLNNDENAGNKIQYGIHHNTFEKNKKVEAKKNFEGKHVLPHELRSGDKIVFSTKLNQESKVSGI